MNTIEIEKETLKKEQPIDLIKLVESKYLKSEFNSNNKKLNKKTTVSIGCGDKIFTILY